MRRLDAALGLIKSLMPAILADIGCDHGLLSKKVLELGLCKGVICSDISAPSLAKAEALLKNHKNVQFIQSDGFSLLPSNIDTAVIMGMGGHEIACIIKSDKNCAKSLILSPQNHQEVVRKSLFEQGFRIEQDFVVLDNNKFYDIILAKKSDDTQAELSQVQLAFGVFYQVKSTALKAKVDKLCKDLEAFKKTPQNLKKMEMVSEVIKWQQ